MTKSAASRAPEKIADAAGEPARVLELGWIDAHRLADMGHRGAGAVGFGVQRVDDPCADFAGLAVEDFNDKIGPRRSFRRFDVEERFFDADLKGGTDAGERLVGGIDRLENPPFGLAGDGRKLAAGIDGLGVGAQRRRLRN